MRRKGSLRICRCCPCICLEVVGNTTEKLNQDNGYPGRHMNPVAPEYKAMSIAHSCTLHITVNRSTAQSPCEQSAGYSPIIRTSILVQSCSNPFVMSRAVTFLTLVIVVSGSPTEVFPVSPRSSEEESMRVY